jgi:hypothetical protein
MNRKIRRTSVLLGLLLAITPLSVSAAPEETLYTDVPQSHWAAGAIGAMREAGVIAGFPDGAFQPSEPVSYAEFIKMVYIAAAGADPGNSSDGHWAQNYYQEAVRAGHFTKYDIHVKELDFSIPRAYMALILSNVIEDAPIEDYTDIQDSITDVSATTPHEYAITKVYAEGLLTGYPDRSFRPDGTLNRAEAATVLYRLLQTDARMKPAPPDPAAAPDTGAKTTLDRYLDPSPLGGTGLVGVIESSDSKKLLSSLVDNTGDFPKILENIPYYEIMDDYPHQMTITHNLLGGERLDIGSKDDLISVAPFLIQGRTLTLLDSGGSVVWVPDDVTATNVFPDFDYIGFYNVSPGHDVLLLVPNNLPKQQ